MSMDRDQAYLLDILSSAQLIWSYIEGVELDEFLDDVRLQDSVIRRIEIIGEAAGRVSLQLREAQPQIPWRDMRGMRNQLIHRYDGVDLHVVWNTAQDSIPRLVDLIESATAGGGLEPPAAVLR